MRPIRSWGRGLVLSMTLRETLLAATSRLALNEHLVAQARRDAELLLLPVLQISHVTLLAYPDREVTAEEMILYEDHLARRLRLEPVQYILGEQEFYGLALKVSPAVLIPRPETEHLVEAVLGLLQKAAPWKIVDVGTGSGAIAIALAVHLPHAEILALDVSEDALDVAADNARRHGVDGRVRFLCSDLLAGLGELGSYDLLVSNPPYVPEIDRAALHPQVRDFEPAAALFAGVEGLDIYRRLIPQAYAALRPGGLIALEIGYGQREALATLLESWEDVNFGPDLQGIPRLALARKIAAPSGK